MQLGNSKTFRPVAWDAAYRRLIASGLGGLHDQRPFTAPHSRSSGRGPRTCRDKRPDASLDSHPTNEFSRSLPLSDQSEFPYRISGGRISSSFFGEGIGDRESGRRGGTAEGAQGRGGRRKRSEFGDRDEEDLTTTTRHRKRVDDEHHEGRIRLDFVSAFLGGLGGSICLWPRRAQAKQNHHDGTKARRGRRGLK